MQSTLLLLSYNGKPNWSDGYSFIKSETHFQPILLTCKVSVCIHTAILIYASFKSRKPILIYGYFTEWFTLLQFQAVARNQLWVRVDIKSQKDITSNVTA